MKVLLVGALGFVGGRLSDFLKKKNLNIINISRRKKFNFLRINWNSEKNINNLCKNVDVVINCSGLDIHGSKNKNKTFVANSKNPLKLLKASDLNGVKFFIHITTYAIYKKKNLSIINEKTKIVADDLHSSSKIEGENNLIKYPTKNTKLVIIRSCNLFGYPKYKNKNCWRLLINYIIKNCVFDKPLYIRTKKNTYKNYSSLESFCNFTYKLLRYLEKEKDLPKIINYTSNKNFSVTEIVDLIKKKIFKKDEKKKFKIYFTNKKLKKEKKIILKSLYQHKIKSINDLFFDKEISNLINYCEKFKL